MTTIFKGSTNGGSNRIFVDRDGDIMVAGQGVGGRQEATVDLLADIWGAEVISTGSLNGPIDDSQIQVRDTADGGAMVVISGEAVGGQYRFKFEAGHYKDVNLSKIDAKLETSGIAIKDGANGTDEITTKAEGAAVNFALFLEQMLEADAFGFIEEAGADISKITNLDDALGGLNDNDIKADFSVKFAGAGVGGSTFTEAFNTKAQAEAFIETVDLANTQNGFLDDILV